MRLNDLAQAQPLVWLKTPNRMGVRLLSQANTHPSWGCVWKPVKTPVLTGLRPAPKTSQLEVKQQTSYGEMNHTLNIVTAIFKEIKE